ncbi:MAG: GTP-binding protein [Hyphomicrobiaceae bacterium]
MIPIALLTGFLGAGKTTVLNALLRDPRFAHSAVLINEFGETGIDGDLIVEFSADVIETTTGCLCCTASSDVRQSLFDLWLRRHKKEVPEFRRVLIETTGLADPAPVIHALTIPQSYGLMDKTVAGQFALASVITTVDAINAPGSAAAYLEALKQIALADAILITKMELTPARHREGRRDILGEMIADTNPGAHVFEKQNDWDRFVDWLLKNRTYERTARTSEALAWLNAEAVLEHGPHAQVHENESRHKDGIRAQCLIIDEPISPIVFNFFMNALQASAGAALLRVKGLVALDDDPTRPVVIHGVQHLVQCVDRLAQWPSTDQRTRIVFIGQNIDIRAMKSILLTKTGKAKRAARSPVESKVIKETFHDDP